MIGPKLPQIEAANSLDIRWSVDVGAFCQIRGTVNIKDRRSVCTQEGNGIGSFPNIHSSFPGKSKEQN